MVPSSFTLASVPVSSSAHAMAGTERNAARLAAANRSLRTGFLHRQLRRSRPCLAILHQFSSRAARHDRDRIEGVDGLAVLIVRGPFDPGDTLRLAFRRDQLDHLAFEMKRIAGTHRLHPAQFVHPGAEQGMRAKGPGRDRKPHRNRRGMPAGGGKPLQDAVLGGFLIEMKRLRIEFGGKAQDLFPRDGLALARKAHPELQIVEPFDHYDLLSCPGRGAARSAMHRRAGTYVRSTGPRITSAADLTFAWWHRESSWRMSNPRPH